MTTITTLKTKTLPPGPGSSGGLTSLLHRNQTGILENFARMRKEYGDIVYTKFGPIHNYILFHPEDVNYVLVKNQKNFVKGIGYDGFRLLVGQGLVTSDGDMWRQQRKMMSPHFTPNAMRNYSDMMAETVNHMLEGWETAAQRGETLHMDTEMMRLTMSVIGRALFSLDLGNTPTEVGHALQEAFAFIPTRSLNPLIPMWFPRESHRRFRRNEKIIDAFIAKQIETGRSSEGQENLLQIMLKAQDEETGRGMDDRQLRDELVTLFFAGFETTARSLTWGWYLLDRHPEVLERIAAEADTVLAGRHPTHADLGKLTYTRQVVDETLRLYPPTAMLARQTIDEDEIGGYPIPVRGMITLVPWIVHRHTDFWPEPEKFDPERFTAEASAKRPKYAYIPFAAGPRVCLGNSFALMEMVYAFAMAAERFRFERINDEPIKAEFSGATRPARPLMMRVTPR
jgi:cytochrome P450